MFAIRDFGFVVFFFLLQFIPSCSHFFRKFEDFDVFVFIDRGLHVHDEFALHRPVFFKGEVVQFFGLRLHFGVLGSELFERCEQGLVHA